MFDKKIEKINFCLVIFSALFLGLLADILFYQKSVGISFFIFNSIIVILSLLLIKKFNKKISKIQFFILISIFLFSAGVFLRTNSFLTFLNIAASLYLLFLFFTLFLDKKILNFDFLDYFSSPLSFLSKSFSAAGKFIEKFKDLFGKRDVFLSKDFFGIIKGIAIAFPFLIVFVWLLSSADLVFQAYLDNLIEIDIDIEIILRALIVLIVSYFFIGIFSKISKNEKSEIVGKVEEKEERKNRFLGFIESSTILILVEFLFLIFIAIQFFYLFGGKDYVWGIAEYITYSEYAKKGFWELIGVSIISFLLIYGLDRFGRREASKEKKIFKLLSAALVFEISVIILSAVKRLFVYTDGYGLTFSRFFAFVFLFWIFFVFLIFLYKKIFLEKKEAIFLFCVFCLTIVFWAGVNILNPDAFIAKKNIERIAQGKELDLRYLSRLSEDAVPEIAQIFDKNIDDAIKERVANDLHTRYNPPYNLPCGMTGVLKYENKCEFIPFQERLEKIERDQKWQSFNFSNAKALSALEENYKEIVEYHTKFLAEKKEQ
jgi:hypothetical protein